MKLHATLVSLVLVGSLASLASGCSGGDAPDVSYCQVEPILNARCRRCHGEPQKNGAPLSLATFDAIVADYPAGSGRAAWHTMQRMVSEQIMPPVTLTPDDGAGPVQPLSDDQRSQLLDWLNAGAPRGAGCTAP
jgi:hypothetical protein